MDEKTAEFTSSVYLSGVVEDAALVLLFMWETPRGVQPVFLHQKKMSLEVRSLFDIPNPYMN